MITKHGASRGPQEGEARARHFTVLMPKHAAEECWASNIKLMSAVVKDFLRSQSTELAFTVLSDAEDHMLASAPCRFLTQEVRSQQAV